jgi:hypothetical protein
VATSKEAYYEYMNNTILVQRSCRFELEAIANEARKMMRAYRSNEFDELIVITDPANNVDFVKEVKFHIIHLIFVVCFVTLYILYL